MKLYAFDLDDTLIKSESKIELTRKGKHYELTPAQYATYVKKSGDVLNFRQFNEIKGEVDRVVIEPMMNIFLKALQDPNSLVAIVTARNTEAASDVFEFFRLYFMFVKGMSRENTNSLLRQIQYKGLNSSDPLAKKDHVDGYVTGEKVDKQGVTTVYFFDDALKNVQAVASLNNEYPSVNIYGYLVKDGQPHRIKV